MAMVAVLYTRQRTKGLSVKLKNASLSVMADLDLNDQSYTVLVGV